MARITPALAGAAVAAAGLAAAGQAAAAPDFLFWKSPSGNIQCMYMAPTNLAQPGKTFVRCDVLQTTRGRSRSAQVAPRGRAGLFEATDAAAGTPQPVLRYGRTFARGPFRCTSKVSGMTCRSVISGHGFTLSRERQRVF
ncbi:MAG: DUF6636 domain-containing protein [Actinomycetota bacterium]